MSVLLISGPPGVGKTETAIAAAAAVRSQFPDAQLFLKLRDAAGEPMSSEVALGRLLTAFGLREDSLPDGTARRSQLYRSLLADRKALIVLDDITECDQIQPILLGQGSSLTIVTSRRWLAGLHPDSHIALSTLGLEDALIMLADLVGHQVVADEMDAAVTVVLRCGLLPAAIRIAAARLRVRSSIGLTGLAERLVGLDLLDELSIGDLDLRAMLAGAVDAMPAEARTTFTALGDLPPDVPVTAIAMSGLLNIPVTDADRRLETLVAEGMLLDEASNYRLPSVMHAYAAGLRHRAGFTFDPFVSLVTAQPAQFIQL